MLSKVQGSFTGVCPKQTSFKGVNKFAQDTVQPIKLNEVFMDIIDDLVARAKCNKIESTDVFSPTKAVYSDLSAKFSTPETVSNSIKVHLDPDNHAVDINIQRGADRNILRAIYEGTDRGNAYIPKSAARPYGETELVTKNNSGTWMNNLLHRLWDATPSVKQSYPILDISPNAQAEVGNVLQAVG